MADRKKARSKITQQELVLLCLVTIFVGFAIYRFIPAFEKGPDHVHSRDDAPKQQQAAATSNDPTELHDEIDKLEAQLRENPEDYNTLRHLGHMYLEHGMPEKAAERFQKAALLNPRAPEIFIELGVALRQSGRPGESVEVLSRIAEAAPDYGDAWLQLAITYRFGLKENEKALQSFGKYLLLESESAVALQVKQEMETIREELKQ